VLYDINFGITDFVNIICSSPCGDSGNPHSSVTIVTNASAGRSLLLFTVRIPALGPTQPPSQYNRGIFTERHIPGREGDYWPWSCTDVRRSTDIIPRPCTPFVALSFAVISHWGRNVGWGYLIISVLRKIFGSKRDGVTRNWRTLHNEAFCDMCSLWCKSPYWARASSLSRLHDRTQAHHTR